MKRENILIAENRTEKRVAAVKFVAPGDVPAFECSIHFGKEENDVTMQNCNIKDSAIVKCSPEDAYDFETGALIALMKMCGVEKVKKAAKETFFDVAENAVNEYEEEIKKLRDEIIELDYRKTCNETTIELLYNTINTLSGTDDKYKELKEENEKLKLDSDLYPTIHCATGSCGGCNELYLVDVKPCSCDLFKYACKKKNITILSNITPKPENFTKAFKKE